MYAQSQQPTNEPLPEIIVPNPPSDSISSLAYSPVSDVLTACSWDGSIYIYSPSSPESHETMSLKTSIPNTNSSPILCSCFSNDGAFLYTGSADGKIRILDMSSGNLNELVGHSVGIGCMTFTASGFLVTGGWDKRLKVWDLMTSQTPIKEILMDHKIFALDSKDRSIVVGLSNNQLVTYDSHRFEKVKLPTISSSYRGGYGYKAPGQMSLNRSYESGSKYVPKINWQIRSISCSNDGNVALVSSIESKVDLVAVQPMEDTPNNYFYSFKCHKTDRVLYPVNKVMFHPIFQTTVVTFGGDGSYTLWDRLALTRLRTGGPQNDMSITTAAFDKTGRFMAYAIGYDWSKGFRAQIPVPVEIRIVSVPENVHKQQP
ncbi:mRNA export factor [Nematocida homosporus]|uniref:mRNA export factor n=1 Tax=Nematocida homosporus TaxID=1912981 RepID=UPI00221E3962|nr:mRNA export factor [Nematocida homosporus]KAI5186434.1 mRNA export factor [Nematocida homosporus]